MKKYHNATGLDISLPTLPSGAVDYPSLIKQYDEQITAVKEQLVAANKQLTQAKNRLSDVMNRRGDCDMDAKDYAAVVLIGQWGQFDESNKCYDQNDRDQDSARAAIDVANTKIKQLNQQLAALQAEKEAALVDNRKQQIADTQAQTDRLKAMSGAAIAAGQVDPEVIKAKADLEAETQAANNKKILYAGVLLVLVLGALMGAYVLISKSKS